VAEDSKDSPSQPAKAWLADTVAAASEDRVTKPERTGQASFERIGRYEIRGALGGGGMGVVYDGHDATLDRHVAIKLLRPDSAGAGSQGRTRLEREAQAMAKLSHPNVATVYEVGEHDGQIFVAMELVRGQTLRAWCDTDDRSWREVLAIYRDVGRGLAAAHDAGIVHRDFKPDNVMVGADGRPRVLDFGLARPAGEYASGEGSVSDATNISSGALDSPLTLTGSVMGTPAYMSPEQHSGKRADARTDQFAYCVALYESLYGERPFAGNTMGELAVATAQGVLRPAPKGSTVPAWVRAAVERGLSADENARYASMRELLAALVRDPNAQRRRRLIQVGAACVIVVAVAIGYSLWAKRSNGGTASGQGSCAAASERLRGIWDDATRTRVGAKFRGHADEFVRDNWRAVRGDLDQYAKNWGELYGAACVKPDEDKLLGAQRQTCLENRLLELEAVSLYLQGVDDVRPFAVGNSGRVIGQRPKECARIDILRAQLPAPPRAIADAVRASRIRLYRARVTVREQFNVINGVRRARPALSEMRAEVAVLEKLGFKPAVAEALGFLGSYELMLRVNDGSNVRRAVELAERIRDDAVVASLLATRSGAFVKVDEKRNYDVAAKDKLLVRAELALTRAGNPTGPRHAFTAVKARHLTHQKRFDEARTLLRSLLARLKRERALSWLASTHGHLSNIATTTKKLAEAVQHRRQQIQLREQLVGRHHPSLTLPYRALAYLLSDMGKVDESVRARTKSLEIRVNVHGAKDLEAAFQRVYTSTDLLTLGRHAAAAAMVKLALPVLRKAASSDSWAKRQLPKARANLDKALRALGKSKQVR